MTISTGVFKQLVYKKEVSLNLIPAAAGAQALRRVTSSLDFKKATYKSNEIRPDMQRGDFRHGIGSVDGSINGELSGATYQDFMGTVCRKAWVAGSTTGAVITVTAASTGTGTGTFTRSAGSYLSDGFKVGDLVRWTGWATTGTPNNAHSMIITALSATVMTVITTDLVAIGAKAAGDSVTCTVAGKKVWIPTSGHLNESYSIEHFFGDIIQSEVFSGCKPSGMNVKLPSTGMATIEFPFMGMGLTTASAQYFTSPNGITSTPIYAAVNGSVFIQGVPVAVITAIDFSVNGNFTSGEVVGSNVRPDIFPGSFDITGNLTVFFQDAVFRDYFKNETEISINAVLTSSSLPAAEAMIFNFPRCKAGGASKDDGEKGLILTMPFTALFNSNGGAALSSLNTTMSIQDTLAV